MAWFLGKPAATSPSARVGVLLVNLGTPSAPTYWPIRRYLWSFLSDRRVVEACPYYWYPLLLGPILTFRPHKTAKLYQSIWSASGSPLLVYSEQLTSGLAQALASDDIRVELAMSYSDPSITTAVAKLLGAGVEKLIVLPLYPQYSGSTSGAVFDQVMRELSRYRVVPSVHFAADYHDDPGFIDALADSVRRSFAQTGPTHLLCSYHGIPLKYVTKGDPYQQQAQRTTQLLCERLGLSEGDYSISFQSRFGPTEWLKPYTDDHLADLLKRGITHVTVLTPAFAVDCLETIEEIGTVSKELYLEAGGESFTLVPALNHSPEQVNWMAAFIRRHAGHWLDRRDG